MNFAINIIVCIIQSLVIATIITTIYFTLDVITGQISDYGDLFSAAFAGALGVWWVYHQVRDKYEALKEECKKRGWQ